MSHRLLEIDSTTPQKHLLRQAIQVLQAGGVIVYPTDSGYALGCKIDCEKAIKRICSIRRLPKTHPMTIVCSDWSALSHVAILSDRAHRLLRSFTPGPYTFLLKAAKDFSKKLPDPNRSTIGIRIPNHIIVQELLEWFNDFLFSTSLILPDYAGVLIEPAVIYDLVGNRVDLVLDAGFCGQEPTSVIDLTGDKPVILRVGKGDVQPFLNNLIAL